jgi:hypothetical protein
MRAAILYCIFPGEESEKNTMSRGTRKKCSLINVIMNRSIKYQRQNKQVAKVKSLPQKSNISTIQHFF